jgi:RND superfamily putative drug exporter
VHFSAVRDELVPPEIGTEIKNLGKNIEVEGLTIEPGGRVIEHSEFEQPAGAEGIGFLFAIVILLIAFGSVLAMGLPIASALFGIGIGLSLIMLIANIINVHDFTPQLASTVGIGVGINYALFIVTRYRQQLPHGLGPEAVVIGLSFILLVVVFRSPVVPLKAVILNLLSISAA